MLQSIEDMAKQILGKDTLPEDLVSTIERWYFCYCRTGGGAVHPGIVALLCLPYISTNGRLDLGDDPVGDDESGAASVDDDDPSPETIFNEADGEIIKVKWRFGRLVTAKLLRYTENNNAVVLIRGEKAPVTVRSENVVHD